jgi:hypothetical protein
MACILIVGAGILGSARHALEPIRRLDELDDIAVLSGSLGAGVAAPALTH